MRAGWYIARLWFKCQCGLVGTLQDWFKRQAQLKEKQKDRTESSLSSAVSAKFN